jgi:glyoxylase-like metal-dependent hydrolase (beta-lactamase superfamily II)
MVTESPSNVAESETATRIEALVVGEWTFDKSTMVQLSPVGTEYDAPVTCYVIDHPAGTVLFDTGLSPELVSDPAGYGTGAAHMTELLDALDFEGGAPALLDDRGYAVSEIDTVVVSHLHMDHAGTLSQFSDAEIVVREPELQYAFWPTAQAQRLFYLDGDIVPLRGEEYTVTTPATTEYDVFGDGSVVAIETPGHAPGHQSLRVQLPDQVVYLGADIANHQEGLAAELGPAFTWSLDEAVESMRTIRERARADGGDIVLTHDRSDLDAFPYE